MALPPTRIIPQGLPRALRAYALLVTFLVLPGTSAGGQQPIELRTGDEVEQRLTSGTAGAVRVSLEQGQFVKLVVDQGFNDLAVTAIGPDGASLGESDGRWYGPEPVARVARLPGVHVFEIRAVEKLNMPSRYSVRLELIRAVEAVDERWIDAEKAATEAKKLVTQREVAARQRAVVVYGETLVRWRELGDRFGEAQTLTTLGFAHSSLGQNIQAVGYYDEALPLWRALGYQPGEANVLNNLAAASSALGDKRKALPLYEESLVLMRATHDRRNEAGTLSNMSAVQLALGQPREALELASSALPIWRSLADHAGQVRTLNNIATIYASIGEPQKALSTFNEVLDIARRNADRYGEGTALRNVGTTYLSLGDYERALRLSREALSFFEADGDRRMLAYTLLTIAKSREYLAQPRDAIGDYERTIAAAREVGDRSLEANAANDVGALLHTVGDHAAARSRLNHAHATAVETGDKRIEAAALGNLGRLAHAAGEHTVALEHYQQSLALFQALGNPQGQATALWSIARVERDRGELERARGHIVAALDMVESLRADVPNVELRASFLATKTSYYELAIDILIDLHQRDPAAGHDRAALHMSERARARSLIDTLAEARAELRLGGDPTLLARERAIRERLNATAYRQSALLAAKHTPEAAAEIRVELESLIETYQSLLATIRDTSPQYAALTQPQVLRAEEIQSLLDDNTVLLEYALGDERSAVWLVSPTRVSTFTLPRRAELEEASRRLLTLLANRPLTREADQRYERAAQDLSQMILGPVAPLLGAKRLVIVADGILQYVPFGALVLPGGQSQHARRMPLVGTYEIVSLPSATVLGIVRAGLENRNPAPKTLAVFADPVFRSDDGRVTNRQPPDLRAAAVEVPGATSDLHRAAADTAPTSIGGNIFPRLRATRREAESILRLVEPTSRLRALDFDANRTGALRPELGNYRIVHFATHGLLNNVHPELSGVVLSLVDRNGSPQDGFVRLHDIYNLDLPVDLIVLSACQTGLGREVKGEGIVGLTRGFMHAGAARVVVSLWNVDDEATAALMERFYAAMLGAGRLSPAAALRAAQLALSRHPRWASPYYWAGFILHGEYR